MAQLPKWTGNPMTDLKTRLAQATEGSRELSDEMLLACGAESPSRAHPYHWILPNGNAVLVGLRPDPSRSVDDVLALVPEGYDVDLKSARHRAGWRVNLWEKDGTVWSADLAAPALALCLALLEAQEADNG